MLVSVGPSGLQRSYNKIQWLRARCARLATGYLLCAPSALIGGTYGAHNFFFGGTYWAHKFFLRCNAVRTTYRETHRTFTFLRISAAYIPSVGNRG